MDEPDQVKPLVITKDLQTELGVMTGIFLRGVVNSSLDSYLNRLIDASQLTFKVDIKETKYRWVQPITGVMYEISDPTDDFSSLLKSLYKPSNLKLKQFIKDQRTTLQPIISTTYQDKTFTPRYPNEYHNWIAYLIYDNQIIAYYVDSTASLNYLEIRQDFRGSSLKEHGLSTKSLCSVFVGFVFSCIFTNNLTSSYKIDNAAGISGCLCYTEAALINNLTVKGYDKNKTAYMLSNKNICLSETTKDIQDIVITK